MSDSQFSKRTPQKLGDVGAPPAFGTVAFFGTMFAGYGLKIAVLVSIGTALAVFACELRLGTYESNEEE